MTNATDSGIAARFLQESSRLLRDVHVPRLRRALELLPPADLFWRPAQGAIACGTILLHLEGNVRAWILSAIGGVPFERDRDAEFRATEAPEGADGRELLGRLAETVDRAAEILGGLDAERLLTRAEFQTGEQDHVQAIYHVVEHFAYHTGQAMWIAKLRGGAGS